MATDDKVASEQAKVEELRRELAELNAPDPAAEDDITVAQLKAEQALLEEQIAARKAQKDRQHELAKDPLAYSQFLLDNKAQKDADRTALVVEQATGDKKLAKAAAETARTQGLGQTVTDENKSGGN